MERNLQVKIISYISHFIFEQNFVSDVFAVNIKICSTTSFHKKPERNIFLEVVTVVYLGKRNPKNYSFYFSTTKTFSTLHIF